jgi:hypothetical protein
MSGERSRSSFAHDPRVDLNPEMSIEMEPMTAARNQTPTFVGKVAFVTGAGSGIGRTTSLAFARESGGSEAALQQAVQRLARRRAR